MVGELDRRRGGRHRFVRADGRGSVDGHPVCLSHDGRPYRSVGNGAAGGSDLGFSAGYYSLRMNLNDYLLSHSSPADDVLRDLAAETLKVLPEQAGMQISHDEGELLTMLVRLIGAR